MRLVKHEKGVAGLNILLGVVVGLFIIGFIVMIFAIMGGQLQDSTYNDASVNFTANQSNTVCGNDTGCYISDFQESGEYNNGIFGYTISACTNTSDAAQPIVQSGNWTVDASTGLITNTSDLAAPYAHQLWNCTGIFSYKDNTTSTDVINKATGSISGVTDWFAIIIVISAMVVLILLTVLIISSIRGSGLIGGSGKGSAPKTSA